MDLASDFSAGSPPNTRSGSSHPVHQGTSLAEWLSGVARDVRFAARSLSRSPGLVAAATVVLALGMGANTVVFTSLSEILLRPLPVASPERLVDIWSDIPGCNSFLGIAWADFTTYRDQAESLDDPFWTRASGADPSVLGREVRVDGIPMDVVGIAPPSFTGHFIGFPVDLWMPIGAADRLMSGFDPEDRAVIGATVWASRRRRGSTTACRGPSRPSSPSLRGSPRWSSSSPA